MGLEVFYDRKNDVVSVYFDLEEMKGLKDSKDLRDSAVGRGYEVDEAANLILDMVDLLDNRGALKGFRVFNASRHYDSSLLGSAEPEELSAEEMRMRASEKVIARFDGSKKLG